MSEVKRVCVFCGAQPGHDPDHARLADALGTAIAKRGLGLVYGGGKVGLMGVVAEAALRGGAEVIGVIPEALMERELGHGGVTELRVVPSMHVRKAVMNDLSDGFVVLPGGIGTLEEAVEIQSWSQLGIHGKGLVFLDTHDYWAPYFALLERMEGEGFIRPQHAGLALRAHRPEEALDLLAGWEPPKVTRWMTQTQGMSAQTHSDWRGLPEAARGATLALGNLDGVHLGHLAVLAAAHQARPDLTLGALTFEPHPREHFRPDDPPFRLTLLPAKAAILGAHGARHIIALPFGAELAAMSAEDFCRNVLVGALGVRHLACGADFAFGHRRGGDVHLLAAFAEANGIGLTIVPHVADGEGTISSTRIRRLLQDGYPERAAAMLGRDFAIVGPVTHGDARGRTIGFPTANIPLGRHLEPARGVYAVLARLPGGRVVKGVANLGAAADLGGDPVSRLEAHLFDFAEDLYDQELSVALVHFLREERKFPDFPALVAQIGADAQDARRILG